MTQARIPGPRQQLGASGEDAAAAWYEAHGFVVVARNWRDGRRGELDLVVRHGRHLVVCEVKTRSGLGFGHPAESVTRAKQIRIRQLGAAFIAAHDLRPASVRFDVAAVIDGVVEIIPSAF